MATADSSRRKSLRSNDHTVRKRGALSRVTRNRRSRPYSFNTPSGQEVTTTSLVHPDDDDNPTIKNLRVKGGNVWMDVLLTSEPDKYYTIKEQDLAKGTA